MAQIPPCQPDQPTAIPSDHAVESSTLMSASAKTRVSRRRVIAAAILAQALVLAVGCAVMYQEFKGQSAQAIERLVFSQNIRVADTLADVIEDWGPQEIQYGSPQWDRLQTMVEQFELSSGGFMCVLDAQGKILCHPKLRKMPGLLGMPMADKILEQPNGQVTTIGDADPSRTLAGRVVITEGNTHYVATKALPSIHGRLMVHQPQSGLTAAGDMATRGLVVPGAITGSAVLILTTFIISFLMRRHDKALETANEKLEDDVRSRVAQATQTRDALIIGLAKLADYRDNDTGLHLDRIATYSVLLAQALMDSSPQIDRPWIDTLRIASTMHDIGKVGIPDAILLKPGKFTPEERKAMQRHPIIGTDTLIAVHEAMGPDDLVEMSMRIALYHHEWWDGKGYPTGLSDEQIPLEARIVAVADVYDALTCKRVYKDAIPHQRVVQIIREGDGTQFDPAVIEAFLRIESAFDQVRQRMALKDALPSNAA